MFKFRKKNKNIYELWDEYPAYLAASEAYNSFEGDKVDKTGELTTGYKAVKTEFDEWTARKEKWHELHNKEVEANKSEKQSGKIIGAVIAGACAIGASAVGVALDKKLENDGRFDKGGKIDDMQKSATRNALPKC